MDKLKIYSIDIKYIEYLRSFKKLDAVYLNKDEGDNHGRKYLGVILEIEGFNYYVPMSSPKSNDYVFISGEKKIRHSVIPIMRMVTKDVNGEDELKGTLRFSNMIPAPNSVLTPYIIETEKDEDYKILVQKEYDFVKSNKDKIIKNANIIYNQKTKEDIYYRENPPKKPGYLDSTIDFKYVEEVCKKYKC